MRVKPPLVGAVVAACAVLGCLMFAAEDAEAGIAGSAVPSFPTAVTVGNSYSASIRIANPNSSAVPNTVCNLGDSGICTGDTGILLNPSCGKFSALDAICDPAGYDPHVYQLSTTGIGNTSAVPASPAVDLNGCNGWIFDISDTGYATGEYRFTPAAPNSHVVLPKDGYCEINFTFKVLKVPTVDYLNNPADGLQTVPLVRNEQTDGVTLGFGRGTTSPVTVTRVLPTIATVASSSTAVAGQLTDVATVAGTLTVPSGTVTFNLYGPNDATCATSVFTSTIGLDSAGKATSAPYVPTNAGLYRWTATYSGDTNYGPVADACNGANESVDVTKANPSIATTASPSVLINQAISDTAIVSGRVNPIAGATVAFNLYGPDDVTCAGAVIFTSTTPVDAGGSATSAAYFPTLPGTYRWTASYSGDANNNPVSEGCNGPNENVVVTSVSSSPPTTPAIATTASGTPVVGGQLIDQATVTLRVNPLAGSTVTFNLYGPNDATCSGAPVFTSTIGLDAAGNATSAAFSPSATGVYRWIARYSGDTNNNPVSGVCGESTETVTVTQNPPTLVTVATVNTALGGLIGDTAQVAGRINPVAGSTVTFTLYGPDDATCSRPAIFSSTVALGADGTATSATFAPTVVGTYRWIAGYSGDANNAPIIAACNAPNEAVALLGPDLQQSLPATGGRTTVPLALGTLLMLSGGMLLFGVRRRPLALRVRR